MYFSFLQISSLKSLWWRFRAGKSLFFFFSSWKSKRNHMAKPTIIVPESTGDFLKVFFFLIVKELSNSFSEQLLKIFTSFSKDTSTEQWFWLGFFWLRKTHNLPNVNLIAFHCQKSQLAIMHFIVSQSKKYYMMDIQIQCMATGFKREKIFFYC